MARRVREHCGFGCAICGRMPTQMEHIEPWAKVQKHEFSNLVLLCSRHHDEVTAGRLGKKDVLAARALPFGKRNGPAKYDLFLSNQMSVDFGSVRFLLKPGSRVSPFSFGGIKPITIELGKTPKFDIRIFDHNNVLALSVVENCFEFNQSRLWDVKLTGRELKVRLGERRVLLSLKIEDSNLQFRQVRMAQSEVPIVVDRRGIRLPKSENSWRDFSIDASGSNIATLFGVGDPEAFLKGTGVRCSSQKEAWDMAFNFKPVELL
ncbi:MAG: HNH endonuclease [Sedimentitalea sp.]